VKKLAAVSGANADPTGPTALAGLCYPHSERAEDCGLGRARVIYTPVLSGLAGVGGVLITALLFSTINGDLIRYPSCVFDVPTPTATASAGETAAIDEPAASPGAEESREDAGGASASPTTTPGREPCGRESNVDSPRLTDIFDIGKNEFGIVVAAIFGLAPGLIVVRLQGQVKRY
jgi:hypothetical protein